MKALSKGFLLCILLISSLCALDNEKSVSQTDKSTQTLEKKAGDGRDVREANQEHELSDANANQEPKDLNEQHEEALKNKVKEKAEEILNAVKKEYEGVLQQIAVGMGLSSLYLGNSVGRIGLVGFLCYKAGKNAKKLFTEKQDRYEHAGKALAYLTGVLMLLQDGHSWMLQQAT